jgi:hypothetical protein
LRNEFATGDTWDDLLPRLSRGERIELVREGPDRFVDVRRLDGVTRRFTFRRSSDGPYKLESVR